MTTAFVLSGGASLGAVQVGMLEALDAAGVRPDVLVGTSVGALNAAYLAGHPQPGGVAGLSVIWRHLRRQDVFPSHPLAGLLGFAGRRNHLVPSSGLRHLIEANLTFSVLEEAKVPLHVVATEVTSGAEVVLSRGPVVPAVLASAAIPGVFAPVEIAGRVLMDGGVADNTPVSRAVELGADRIYVLSASYPCALTAPPPTALGMVVQALTVLIQNRLASDVDRFEPSIDLRVVPPLCPLGISPVDFRHSGSLIERARASTERWLADGPPGDGQAGMLTVHSH